MAVNVLLTRKFFPADIQYIRNGVKPECKLIIPEAFSEEDLLPYAKDADIFFGPVISKRLCEAAGHLQFIQVPWTGVDNLNFDLIREIGVKVCNSHSNAYAVAEQAVSLMMDAAKKLSYHDRIMRTGDWNRPKPDGSNLVSPFSKRISGRKVCIVGFGHIGSLIRQYLSGFDCAFNIADISVAGPRQEGNASFFPMNQLGEALTGADYVFLCVPLTEQTRGFWGEAELRQMGRDAILINTSRGEIVDEDALFRALSGNLIAGAAMDTWYNNPKNPFDIPCPPSLKHPFQELDNLVLSPHRAAMIAGELPHLDDAILNINRTIDGLDPLNVISIDKRF